MLNAMKEVARELDLFDSAEDGAGSRGSNPRLRGRRAGRRHKRPPTIEAFLDEEV